MTDIIDTIVGICKPVLEFVEEYWWTFLLLPVIVILYWLGKRFGLI